MLGPSCGTSRQWAEITFYLLIPVVLIAFAAGVAWRVRKWFVGRAEPGAEKRSQASPAATSFAGLRPRRLLEWVRTALFQARLSSDGFSLVMHLAIFWGMLVLAIGTGLATVDQDFTNLLFDTQILRGVFYRLIKLALDVFGVVLILGLGMAAYRRYVVRPERLRADADRGSLWDGFPFLARLVSDRGHGVSDRGIADCRRVPHRSPSGGCPGAGGEGPSAGRNGPPRAVAHGPAQQDAELARIAAGDRSSPRRPGRRWAMGWPRSLAPLPTASIRLAHQLIWWLHGLTAFGLIVAIPFTKAFPSDLLAGQHALADPAPPGRLPVVVESGVRTVRDYTWRQLLQVDACTWCGKCQEACPGLRRRVPALAAQPGAGASTRSSCARGGKATGRRPACTARSSQPEELWACCTCRACEEVCPVLRPAPAPDHRPPPAPRGPGPSGRRAPGRLDEFPAVRQLLRPVGRASGPNGRSRSTSSSRTHARKRSSTCGSWATTPPTTSGPRR